MSVHEIYIWMKAALLLTCESNCLFRFRNETHRDDIWYGVYQKGNWKDIPDGS